MTGRNGLERITVAPSALHTPHKARLRTSRRSPHNRTAPTLVQFGRTHRAVPWYVQDKARLSAPGHRWSLPVRNRPGRTDSAALDRIGARSSSHLLVDQPLPQHELQNGAAKPNGMPREQILPGLNEHDSRDFDLAPDPAIGVPGGPLVAHFFPESADGKAEGPFPGPTHVYVATLILNILADDIATQTVPGAMTGLVRLDPDDWSPMEGLPL